MKRLAAAAVAVDVLVFSGTFYAQTRPASDAVATCDREEGLGGTLAAKIRSALTYYRPTAAADGCQLRLDATTLYASLFRYDDDHGQPARLRRARLGQPHASPAPAGRRPARRGHS